MTHSSHKQSHTDNKQTNPPRSPVQNRNIVLCNVYADGNKGGAAITIATIQFIKLLIPGALITLVPVAVPPERVSHALRFTLAAHPDCRIASPRQVSAGPLAGVRHAFALLLNILSKGHLFASAATRAVSEASVVVGKGGQGFRGSPGKRAGRVKKSLALLTTFHPLLLASRLGKRSAVHGVTIGPFVYAEPTWVVARLVLRSLDLISVRTVGSIEECLRLDVDPDRITLAPDVIFGWDSIHETLRPPSTEPEQALFPPLEDERYFCVTLRTVAGYGNDDTVKWFSLVLRQLLKEGACDRFILIRHAGGIRSQDHQLSLRLTQTLGPDFPITYDDRDHSPSQLMDLYRDSLGILGGRVHSTIFGLIARTLAFPVDGPLHDKAGGIFKEIGAEDLTISLPPPGHSLELSAQESAARIIDALEHRDTILSRIRASIQSSQDDIVDSVAAVLDQRPAGDTGAEG